MVILYVMVNQIFVSDYINSHVDINDPFELLLFNYYIINLMVKYINIYINKWKLY